MKALLRVMSFCLCLGLFVTGCDKQSSQSSKADKSGIVELTFFFPIQTSGPLAVAMGEIVDNYNSMQQEIKVNAVFTGNYTETIQKTLTSVSANNAPHVVLSSGGGLLNYINVNAILDVKPLIAAEEKAFIDDYVKEFWPMFIYGEKIYGVPFQHSAPIMYYNKDIFRKAGLDPNRPPKTWTELEMAIDKIFSWNAKIVPYEFQGDDWMLQAMACSNGGDIFIDDGHVTFDLPEVVEAVDYWKKLLAAKKAMNNKSYGGVTENFIAGGTAIMFNSTGSLGNVIQNATFDWDVAIIPANEGKQSAVPFGGGGFILLAGHSEVETQAAWSFIKYMTSPEITARWSMVSGYFAMRESAYDLPELKKFFEEKPQYARTRAFLPYLVKPYITTKQPQVAEILNRSLDEILIKGNDTKATLSVAQKEAQLLLE